MKKSSSFWHSVVGIVARMLLKQYFRTEFHSNKYFLLPESPFFFFNLKEENSKHE